MTRHIDDGTICSSLSPARARRVIRSRLRLPLALSLWMFGIGQAEDMVVGTVVGPRVFARPVPGNWPEGRLLWSMAWALVVAQSATATGAGLGCPKSSVRAVSPPLLLLTKNEPRRAGWPVTSAVS